MEGAKSISQAPDIRPRPRTSGPWSVFHYSSTAAESYRPRISGPGSPDIRPLLSPRRSGHRPGNLAPQNPRAENATTPARTSGLPCLCTVKGRGPCIPSPPRLYILHPVQLSRVSIGLAHFRDRALLIHIRSTLGERPRPLRRTPLWIQDLLLEKNFKTSSRRRPVTMYRP